MSISCHCPCHSVVIPHRVKCDYCEPRPVSWYACDYCEVDEHYQCVYRSGRRYPWGKYHLVREETAIHFNFRRGMTLNELENL
jgi:hypothetical protein